MLHYALYAGNALYTGNDLHYALDALFEVLRARSRRQCSTTPSTRAVVVTQFAYDSIEALPTSGASSRKHDLVHGCGALSVIRQHTFCLRRVLRSDVTGRSSSVTSMALT